MTKKAKHTTRDKWKKYFRDLGDGMKLEAEVGPCVFMYPGYPLQITVTLQRRPGERLGEAHAVDRTKTGMVQRRVTLWEGRGSVDACRKALAPYCFRRG